MSHKPSYAYRGMEQYAQADVEQATMLSQAGSDRIQSTRLEGDDNLPLLPPGTLLFFHTADLAQVKKGRFVLARRQKSVLVRRLVRREVIPGGLLMHLATAGGRLEEPLPAANLLGEVVGAEVNGRRFDPSRSSGLQALADWLTEWGTSSPGRRLLNLFAVLVPPGLRGGSRKG